MKRNNVDDITKVIRLAAKYGMTYAELQCKESLGLVKIVNGKLLFKGKDY